MAGRSDRTARPDERLSLVSWADRPGKRRASPPGERGEESARCGAPSGTGRGIRAGLPATMLPAGTSLVTTLPAPTMAPSPISTPHRIVEPEPIDALLRTIVGTTFQSSPV